MPRGKKRQPQRKNGWQEPLWNLVNRKSGTCEFRRSSWMVTCQRGFWDIWNTDNKKNEIRYFGGWRQDCRLRPFRVCTRPAWGQLVWQRVHRRGVHGEFLRAVQGTARGDGENRHPGAVHGRPEKVRLHQGLRSPFLLLLRSLPVSHGPTGIFLFIAVVFPSCCLLVYRYLANMSSRYLHSLTYHYSNNISCYNIRSLVYHYPKNVSCQYLHGLTCHNPSNIGENPGLPPDCHLLCLLLALTIHVYIWL